MLPLRRRTAIAIPLALMTGFAACSRTPEPPKVPLAAATAASSEGSARDALPAAAREALDLGNTEFRAGRYGQALAAYRKAADVVPNDAAPYFGIYMTAKKLGDSKMAADASKAIAARNGANLMLTDTGMQALHSAPKPAGPK